MLRKSSLLLTNGSIIKSTSNLLSPTDHPTVTPQPLQLVECPRDAMQGITKFIPTKDKIRFINSILKCGFHTVDCGSFVSPKNVPQMADTPEVLEGLDLSGSKSKLLVIVPNLKGTETACQYEKVTYIGFPLSASEIFQNRNTKKSVSEALIELAKVNELCAKNNKHLVTYISMAFGNPYGEHHSIQAVDDIVGKVANIGCQIIALGDTIGVGTAELIKDTYTQLIPKYSNNERGIRLGGHFHSGVATACEKVRAAYESGCTRLDGAVGGMGGCPFAKDSMVGNIPTIAILETLESLNVSHGIDRALLEISSNIKHDTFGVGVKELLLAQVLHNERLFVSLCRHHFDKHDSKGNGDMDMVQFGRCMSEVFQELGEMAPTEEKIQRWFRKLVGLKDVNDGFLTFDEYMVGARYLLSKRLNENNSL